MTAVRVDDESKQRIYTIAYDDGTEEEDALLEGWRCLDATGGAELPVGQQGAQGATGKRRASGEVKGSGEAKGEAKGADESKAFFEALPAKLAPNRRADLAAESLYEVSPYRAAPLH